LRKLRRQNYRSLPTTGIVMATHGRGGLPHLVLGSLVESMARRSSVPVLLGATVHITEFCIDGYALPTVAGAWAVAPPTEL
jgi:hypothetical protein